MPTLSDLSSLLAIYENCVRSRCMERRLAALWYSEPQSQGMFSGFGSELAPSMVAMSLEKDDYLIPNYRGIAAPLAKGVSLYAIAAEALGKETGGLRGIGDTRDIKGPSCGIPGNTINLGAMFSVALGIAFSVSLKKEGRFVTQLFGDGEASRVPVGSTLNLAALWKLPILFVCLNNGISIHTKSSEMSATKNLSSHARGYGMNAETLTEDEPQKLHVRIRDIVKRVRETRQPFFLEIFQKRLVPHSTWYGNLVLDDSFIPKTEDPLFVFRNLLKEHDVAEREFEQIYTAAERETEEAFQRAAKDRELSSEDFLSFYYA